MCSAFSHPPISQFSIRQLLPSASFVGCGDIQFRDVCIHSARCKPGDLFIAMSGTIHHGCDFVEDAMSRGARGVLTDTPLSCVNAPQCIVSDVRRTYGWLCQYLQGQPGNDLNLIGVTGTNGKTSITWLLRSILRASGKQPGLLGTVENDDSRNLPCPSAMTTQDPANLAHWLRQIRDAGGTHAVLEVSSHALSQKRLAGIQLQTAIISNITQDHLDYHGSLDEYCSVKGLIADYCKFDGHLIINGDDPRIRQSLACRRTTISPITVGFGGSCEYRIEITSENEQGSQFLLRGEDCELLIAISIPGRFNIFNAALAAVAALKQGCSPQQIQQGLRTAAWPPGRLQRVETGQPFSCFVDYAHTPDAIENIIETMRPHVSGRLICVFGAGGNRDRSKRPLMTQAALAADVVVLTADNPRHEPQVQIFNDLLSGFPEGEEADLLEADRRSAIAWAVGHAEPGDCVLILGKGHETTQQVGDSTQTFDDVAEVQNALRSLSANVLQHTA